MKLQLSKRHHEPQRKTDTSSLSCARANVFRAVVEGTLALMTIFMTTAAATLHLNAILPVRRPRIERGKITYFHSVNKREGGPSKQLVVRPIDRYS